MRLNLLRSGFLKKWISSLTVLCFLTSSFAGCMGGGSGDSSTEVTYSAVQGRACFDGPISDGDVEITDEDGNVLAAQSGLTDQDGYFSIVVGNLPDSFFITVRGGNVIKEDDEANTSSKAFSEQVDRYVESFDPAEIIKVNILSSLLLDFWQAQPEKDLAGAKQAMHDFLGYPGYLTLEEVIDLSDWYGAYFDPEYFFEAMEANGLATYDEFMAFLVDYLQGYLNDPNDQNYQNTVLRNMPEGLRNSALSLIVSEFGDRDSLNASLALVANGSGEGSSSGSTVSSVIDMGVGIVGFLLNAIYRNMPEGEAQQVLGKFLAFVFEGGTDPMMEAMMANLFAIQEGVIQIQKDMDRFWKDVSQQLTEIKAFVIEEQVNTAIRKTGTQWDRLQTWRKNYKDYKTIPNEGLVNQWVDDVVRADAALDWVATIHQYLVGNTVSGKSMLEVWAEQMKEVGSSSSGQRIEPQLYEIFKQTFAKLLIYQAMAATLYSEAVNKKYGTSNPAQAKAEILSFLTTLVQYFKEEVQKFEEVAEDFAMNQEWRLYASDPSNKMTAKDRSPNFPCGLADQGILADVDRMVQRYVFADVTVDQGVIKSINQQHLITVRVVAPVNDASQTEDFGLVGLEKQSSRYWSIYKDHIPNGDKGKYSPNWLPLNFPEAPADPPGKDSADKDFGLQALDVGGYLQMGDSSVTATTTVITGRSPMETRNTPKAARKAWDYRMFKFRRTLSTSQGFFYADKNYPVEFNATPDQYSMWHPGLNTDNQTTMSMIFRYDSKKDPAMCASLGAYGVKAYQLVRLMAFHNSAVNDWWYRGWKGNNYDMGRLFANKHDAFTFFQLIPLGYSWYALKDHGTRYQDLGVIWEPIKFFGQQSHFFNNLDKNRTFVRVSTDSKSPGQMVFTTPVPDYFCTFKIEFKKQVDPVRANQYYAPWDTYTPASKAYTFKTNYPNIDDPNNNKYLKWRYRFAQWDWYEADASAGDTGSSQDTWVLILPEYPVVVDYLKTRAENWNPFTQ